MGECPCLQLQTNKLITSNFEEKDGVRESDDKRGHKHNKLIMHNFALHVNGSKSSAKKNTNKAK